MKIEELRVLNGPNYWSINKHQLILMRLNLEEMEEFPTNKIPGFYDRMLSLLPSLYVHRCSEGAAGGFFKRVKDGTWIGHVIEHIALEIQTLAGMDTGFGRTRSTGKAGIYNIVFSYCEPKAGKYAASAAFNIAEALIHSSPYDLQKDIDELKRIWEEERFGPSTGAIVSEALKRDIPYIRLNEGALVQLGYGVNQTRIEAAIASTTSSIAVEIAGDKSATKKLLMSSSVPVPAGDVVYNEEELWQVIKEVGYPVVIKPRDGNQGKGATININNGDDAIIAFATAQGYSESVMCEKFIPGHDFRVLIINNQFIAAARRKPAAVIGDGVHTIQELIDQVNADIRRGNGHGNVLTKIRVNEKTMKLLRDRGQSLASVLPEGEECFLKSTANLSTGGTATDVTDTVHQKNIELFKRISRIIGLNICGIDIIAPDLSTPISKNGGAIIEVNASPGLRMHLQPSEGKPRNVAFPIIDMLYPQGTTATIPIIAVTGTNGKTTTTRLIAYMCRDQKLTTGFTTTEGIYIQDERIVEGDCSGPASAQEVLKDPSVEIAVFECARGGILRNGLGFNHCNVAVITNVAEDHLGLGGIDTLEKMARVKGVVAESVARDGFVILNADDDLVYNMRKNVVGKVALFSLDKNNPRILEHCKNGGKAALFDGTCIIIISAQETIRVDDVKNIPITFNGKAEFNIANVLGAVLAGYVLGFSINSIRRSLNSFIPSPELTPGRMNLFYFHDFTVLIDYAHNPHGMYALGKYIQSLNVSSKVGIIAGTGDRRDEDLVNLGEAAARIFDDIIIRMDDDTRGRTQEDIFALISKGIKEVNKNKNVLFIPDESEAVHAALTCAKPGSFVVVLTDRIAESIEITTAFLEKEKRLARTPTKALDSPNSDILRKEAI